MENHTPKVALVYDKVSVSYGGAERVLVALGKAFADAPLYTAICSNQLPKWSKSFSVRPSFLRWFNWIPNSYRLLLPVFPVAFESLNLSEFDIIISITSGEAKGILSHPNQLHVCYLLTPPRYLYSHSAEYQKHPLIQYWPIRTISTKLLQYLRWWDAAAAQRPDVIIPISRLVAQRAKQIYERTTNDVIYPPIPPSHTPKILRLPNKYLLSVSRLVPYKRVDLSIAACKQSNLPLLVVGTGMERNRLIALAGSAAVVRNTHETLSLFFQSHDVQPKKIYFIGNVSESELSTLYAAATALLLPGIEDYGIAALEAAQHGVPSILHYTSGVAELLTAPKHSILLRKLTINAMIEAIEQLNHQVFYPGDLQKVASYHTFSYFQKEFKKRIQDLWTSHSKQKES